MLLGALSLSKEIADVAEPYDKSCDTVIHRRQLQNHLDFLQAQPPEPAPEIYKQSVLSERTLGFLGTLLTRQRA